MAKKAQDIKDRFYQKTRLAPTGCLEWIGGGINSGFGYGGFKANIDGYQRWHHAHRVAWFIHHGSLPILHVLHHCDNPRCVNIEHLFLGTPLDNIRDCIQKGRRGKTGQGRGENHFRAKLTNEQIGIIRNKYVAGKIRQQDLAQSFSVDQTTISRIVRNMTY